MNAALACRGPVLNRAETVPRFYPFCLMQDAINQFPGEGWCVLLVMHSLWPCDYTILLGSRGDGLKSSLLDGVRLDHRSPVSRAVSRAHILVTKPLGEKGSGQIKWQ